MPSATAAAAAAARPASKGRVPVLLLALTVLWVACSWESGRIAVGVDAFPSGFYQQTMIENVAAVIEIRFLPDGRLLLGKKNGNLRISSPLTVTGDEESSTSLYLNLEDVVDDRGDRGFMSMALDPAFPVNGYIYIYYSHYQSERNRISRFTHQGDHSSLNTEQVIWQDNEIIQSCCHYGGSISFGPDGKIYLVSAYIFVCCISFSPHVECRDVRM